MEKVTLEKLNELAETSSDYEIILWAQEQKESYPASASKPTLPKGADSERVKQYAIELKAYEEYMVKYKQDCDRIKKINWEINEITTVFIQQQSGLNDIPEQYRVKVYSLAYQQGHSYGYYDVYNKLVELVDIFN